MSLSPAARLLIEALRCAALASRTDGARRWRIIRTDFARHCGERNATAVLAAFIRFIIALQTCGGAAFRLHRPCCPQLTGDELDLVAMVAACQCGDPLRARRLAETRAALAEAGDLLAAAEGLAAAMRAGNLDMRLDYGAGPYHADALDRGGAPSWASCAIH